MKLSIPQKHALAMLSHKPVTEVNWRCGRKSSGLQIHHATLDKLTALGLIRVSHHNNGSRDARYLSTWLNVVLTDAGRAMHGSMAKVEAA